jgi:hypothetical protein
VIYANRPKLRLFGQSAGGWYSVDLALGRPTNPARIKVGPLGRWYYCGSSEQLPE